MVRAITILILSFCFSICYGKPIVVFDFGGVIGGSSQDLMAKQIAQTLRLPLDQGKKMVQTYREVNNLKVSMKDFWVRYALTEKIKLPKDWGAQFDDIRLHAIQLNPGMMELVYELKNRGYQVAMLSNVTSGRARAIRDLGVYDPFVPTVLSCEIGVEKPSKKAFRVLLQHMLGVKAQECLFIDDKSENVKVSREMGFDAIRFVSYDDLKLELAKRKIYVGVMPKQAAD